MKSLHAIQSKEGGLWVCDHSTGTLYKYDKPSIVDSTQVPPGPMHALLRIAGGFRIECEDCFDLDVKDAK